MFERLVFLALLKLRGRHVCDVLEVVGEAPDAGWPDWLDPKDTFVSERVIHQDGTAGFIDTLRRVASGETDVAGKTIFVPSTAVGPGLIAWTESKCLISAAISIHNAASSRKDRNNLRTADAYNCYTKALQEDGKPQPLHQRLHNQGKSAVRKYQTAPFVHGGVLKQIRWSITLPHAARGEFVYVVGRVWRWWGVELGVRTRVCGRLCARGLPTF